MKFYVGVRHEPQHAGPNKVLVITTHVDDDENLTCKWVELKHRVRHSPTGLEWGYSGSGPADLARSLCWDAMGREMPPRVYQYLKFRLVAGFGDVWAVTETLVRQLVHEAKAEAEENDSLWEDPE